nr:MAG TPA: Peptidyl-tRNA hydrolase [Caudoviricetes sp.]
MKLFLKKLMPLMQLFKTIACLPEMTYMNDSGISIKIHAKNLLILFPTSSSKNIMHF